MTAALDMEAGMAQVRAELARLGAAIEAGAEFDLSRLNDRVAALSGMVARSRDTMHEEGRRVMLALAADLGAFEATLRAKRAEAEALLGDVGARRRATTAYGRK
jgi:hypothetical protein